MRSSAVLFMSLAMALGAVCLAFAAPGRDRPGTMIELDNVSGARDDRQLARRSGAVQRDGDAAGRGRVRHA